MDNYQNPQMPMQGQPMQPMQQMQQPMMQPGGGMPMVQQVQLPPPVKKDVAGLVKTIVIIILSLALVTFIGLFIWKMMEYDEVSTDVRGQINVAVAEAKDEQATQDEAEFLEREKYPYNTFMGPVDYGALTFEYPKTWSVYIENAANETGQDFHAYLNPIQVDAVGNETINALRVEILNKGFDDVVEEYQRSLEDEKKPLSVESVMIGKNGDIAANRYTGVIPRTELQGIFVVFKIRDKTVILRTDSMLFQEEFDKLIGTVSFNS